MEKRRFNHALIFSIVVSLALVAFVSCIAAETHRTKTKDIKLDGKLCYLPDSSAFGFGIAAMVCLVMAQFIGNSLVICRSTFRFKSNSSSSKRPKVATILLLVVSWASFTVALVLLSAASSMSREQPYSAGWLAGDCYLVKTGVYGAAGILSLVAAGSTVGAAVTNLRNSLQIDELNTTYAPPK